MSDAPLLLRPMGVFQCGTCNGKGKIGLTEEQEAALKEGMNEFSRICPNCNEQHSLAGDVEWCGKNLKCPACGEFSYYSEYRLVQHKQDKRKI
jgi:hypothetical protein